MNTHIQVAVAGGEARPSRVEDATDGFLVVSRPTDAGGYPLAGQPGVAVVVRWTSDWGVHEVAGTIVETVPSPVPRWTLRAEAAPPVNQRREAFRLEVRLPLSIAAGGGAEVHGTVIDVSEGGLGFEVPAGTPLRERLTVRATLPLDDGDLTLTATVVRLGEARKGTCCGGMRFDDMTEDLATRVRRYVLQEQIRRRALVRD